MASELTDWVKSELKNRSWSLRELGRRSGLSHSAISQTLNGQITPTANFCYRVARAMDKSPEDLMRLAGLSAPLPDYGDQLVEEILEETRRLPPDKRKQLLDFARFLRRGANE